MIKSILAVIFLLISSGNKDLKTPSVKADSVGNYSISGKIHNYNSGWIYLGHADGLRKDRKTDSTRIVNGAFSFSGKISGMEPFILGVHDKDSKGKMLPSIIYQGPFFLSPGHLYIEGGFDDWRSPLTASGNKAQDEYNVFRKKVKLVNNINEVKQVVKAHVVQFPNSLVSAYIAKSNLLNTDPNFVKLVYDKLTPTVKKSVYGKALLQIIKSTEATAVGRISPSFTMPDSTGQLVSLEASKGTYTLIDFWASWCGPCRTENPNLIKAYNRYKAKGFKIISISIDTNKALWLKAIVENKLTWLQLSDLKGIESKTVKKYGITAIPMNFLIDKEGKIIARNLRGVQLEEELKKIFKY